MLADFQNSFTVVFSMKFATNSCHISRHALDVLLHYPAKYKRPKLGEILLHLTQ